MRRIFTFIVLFVLSLPVFSQNDTVGEKDSAYIYKKIQKFAYKRPITQWMFQGVFKDITTVAPATDAKVQKKENPYGEYFKRKQGKIIRSIRIVTIDPFGRVQGDTVAIGRSDLENAGNDLHVKTVPKTIRDLLLFKEGEPLDSIKLIESERLLRAVSYLGEAKIKARNSSGSKDHVDVQVIVRDLWSIDGSAAVSTNSNSMEFSEKNFFGLGHQIRNDISFGLQSPSDFTSAGSYLVPNIERSFVAGTLYYHTSDYDKGVGISFDRGFFSPLTKWAGGINLNTNNTGIPYKVSDGSTQHLAARSYSEDVWLGRGFTVNNSRFNAYKDPRILIAARVYNKHYTNRPSFIYDTLKLNQGTTSYLSSVSISSRNYYKDKNIYEFGRIEDVPEGRFIALIGGLQVNEFAKARPYYGGMFSYGEHIEPIGYLAFNMEYGSFVGERGPEEGVMEMGFHFFNDLWTYRKWGMRQFVSFKLTDGIRRDPRGSIDINGDNGIEGFSSEVLKGVDRGVLSFASVIYLPYKWVGFQFAPFMFASFAGIGPTTNDLLKGKIYQGYGLGVLIRNEFLIIRRMQISFGFYPEIPGVGNDVSKFNSIRVSNLRFADLYFSKPQFIGYD